MITKPQKIYDRVFRLVSIRPRSVKEIKSWLSRKKIGEKSGQEVIDRLIKLELLDDRKFAEWWVEQRTNFSPRGRKILHYELRVKGMSKDIIEEVLDKAGIDEEKIASDLLEKKSSRWKDLPADVARQKISEFLARKGFSWEVVKKVLKR